MTDTDGDRGDMHRQDARHPRFELDEPTVARLLSGEIAPEEAPPAYAAVAQVLDAAAAPAAPDELEAEAAVRSMFVSEHRRGAPAADLGSERARRRRHRGTVAAIAVAGTLVLTSGVAAATGHLPDAAQGAVHDLGSHVGLDLPDAPATDEAPPDPDPAPGEAPDTPTSVDISEPDPGPAPGPAGQDQGRAACAEAGDRTCPAGERGRAGEQEAPAAVPSTTPSETPTTGPPAEPGRDEEPPRATPTTGPPAGTPTGPADTPASTRPAASPTQPSTGPPESAPAGPPVSPSSTQPSRPPSGSPPSSAPSPRGS